MLPYVQPVSSLRTWDAGCRRCARDLLRLTSLEPLRSSPGTGRIETRPSFVRRMRIADGTVKWDVSQVNSASSDLKGTKMTLRIARFGTDERASTQDFDR